MSHKHTLSPKKHAEKMTAEMAAAKKRRENGELPNAVRNFFKHRDEVLRGFFKGKETNAKPRKSFGFH